VTLLPEANETMVVAHDLNEVVQRMSGITSQQLLEPGMQPTSLSGWVKNDRFQAIIRQRRLNSFMPVVEGTIDSTRNGCLIFLRYRLMPFTRLYLVLWTVIALVSGLCLMFYHHNIFVGLAAAAIIVVIHAVAWANFKIHMQPLHDIIFNVLG
jgi:hypothetical protein